MVNNVLPLFLYSLPVSLEESIGGLKMVLSVNYLLHSVCCMRLNSYTIYRRSCLVLNYYYIRLSSVVILLRL